jgi:acyl-CoA thioester hydrolase
MLVIARLVIDFRAELTWPGEVEIGTRVEGISNRSFTLSQALFHNGKCAATSESTIVLVDERTRRSTPLSEELVNALAQWKRPA